MPYFCYMALDRYLIDEEEAVMVVNSLVDKPAHQRKFIAFKADKSMLFFNEEKQMVTGVVIEANKPIYRRDESGYEYEVEFTPKAIENIAVNYFKEGKHNMIDINHNGIVINNAVAMVESFFKSESKHGGFSDVADGSWIATYKVFDAGLWDLIKKGEVNGFSVFISANLKPNKMNKFSQLISELKQLFEAQKFAEIQTIDGITLIYDGELKEGTQVQIKTADGTATTPNVGDEFIVLVDEVQKKIVIGENGVITAIQDVAEVAANEDLQQFVAVVGDAIKKLNEKISLLEQTIVELKETKTEKFKVAENSENKGNQRVFKLN